MCPQSESRYKIQVRKWNGRSHYSWSTHLLLKRSDFIWVGCPGPRELLHETKGKTFTFGTHAMEWFWKDAWFSLGVFLDPDSRMTGFYCNLHKPFVEVEGGLEFVDLDIDVVKKGNQPSSLEDLDEFEVHGRDFSYPSWFMKALPDYARVLSKALDADPWFSGQSLGALFDLVMIEGGPSLDKVSGQWQDHLLDWPNRFGPGLEPVGSSVIFAK